MFLTKIKYFQYFCSTRNFENSKKVLKNFKLFAFLFQKTFKNLELIFELFLNFFDKNSKSQRPISQNLIGFSKKNYFSKKSGVFNQKFKKKILPDLLQTMNRNSAATSFVADGSIMSRAIIPRIDVCSSGRFCTSSAISGGIT